MKKMHRGYWMKAERVIEYRPLKPWVSSFQECRYPHRATMFCLDSSGFVQALRALLHGNGFDSN